MLDIVSTLLWSRPGGRPNVHDGDDGGGPLDSHRFYNSSRSVHGKAVVNIARVGVVIIDIIRLVRLF
jgi:hypothetical protein